MLTALYKNIQCVDPFTVVLKLIVGFNESFKLTSLTLQPLYTVLPHRVKTLKFSSFQSQLFFMTQKDSFSHF